MTVVTIRPDHFWQVDYGSVAAKDPGDLVLTGSPTDTPNNEIFQKRAAFAEFDIDSEDSYRHGVITAFRIMAEYSTTTGNYYNFYKNNGVDLDLHLGKTINSAGDEKINRTGHSANQWISATDPTLVSANGKIYIGVTFYGYGSSGISYFNGMQLELTYVDGVFAVELSKTGGYIPATVANSIKVSAAVVPAMIAPYTIKSCVLYYKKSSESAYTSISSLTDTIIIPANTFEEDEEYDYYVTAVSDDDKTVTSDVYTVSTGDVQGTVTALSPSNTVAYGSPNFAWSYENELGNQQTAFDLQISVDGTTWSDLVLHEETPNTFYTASVPVGGLIYWRVRSYNQSDVATNWSNVLSFTNVMPPSAPTITSVTGNGRITVQWNAANQIAYQVMIGDHDSGWIYSTEKQYFYNEYLADGLYEIKVRITNNIGLVSDWAELSYSQSGSLPGPVATVTMREGYNEISVSGSFDRYYIIRNGVVIAQIADGMYEDYYCNGNDSYVVRGVNNDDTFGDTLLTGAYTCHKPALIDPDGTITYVNERLDEQPQITSSDTADVAMVEYLGRSLPVHHVGQMQKRTWTVACSEKIKPGQIYFYRNFRGDKAWVICANVQSSLNWFGVHEYQYTLEETDCDEAVGYAV